MYVDGCHVSVERLTPKVLVFFFLCNVYDRPDPFENRRPDIDSDDSEGEGQLGSKSKLSGGDEDSSKGQTPPIKLAMWVSDRQHKFMLCVLITYSTYLWQKVYIVVTLDEHYMADNIGVGKYVIVVQYYKHITILFLNYSFVETVLLLCVLI